jgi:hypothetical protein
VLLQTAVCGAPGILVHSVVVKVPLTIFKEAAGNGLWYWLLHCLMERSTFLIVTGQVNGGCQSVCYVWCLCGLGKVDTVVLVPTMNRKTV